MKEKSNYIFYNNEHLFIKSFMKPIGLCDKVYQLFARGRWFFPGTSVSPTKKNDRHDITAILLKVAFITMAQTRFDRSTP
jgi:hypothetical protein